MIGKDLPPIGDLADYTTHPDGAGGRLAGSSDIAFVEEMRQIAKACPRLEGRLAAMENVGQDNGRYYDFLHALVLAKKPRLIVELGTNTGVSACVMADAATQYPTLPYEQDGATLAGCGEVVSVDIITQAIAADRARLWPNVMLIQKHSHWVPRVLPLQPKSVDFLFIDSEHSYNQAVGEMIVWAPYLKPGAIICADDIDLNDEMRSFWRLSGQVPTPRVGLPALHPMTGFGVALWPGGEG